MPIRFVYSERYRESGSTVMRGQQLSEIGKRALPQRNIGYVSLEAEPRNSLLFLTKGALKAMTMSKLESLRSAGNKLIFDVVDEVPPPITRDYAHVVSAASITAYLDLSADFPHLPVHLVNHHVDPRLSTISAPPPTDKLRCAYFGESVNAILSPAVMREVTVVHIDTSRQDADWLPRLEAFNFHYAVRAHRDLDHHKPFLKGFTAAHRGSNILIQSTQTEAVRWLGTDYPYLIAGEATETKILAALDYARESFGHSEWMDGLARMRDIRERTSNQRIGGELAALFALAELT
ncbi:hypothetical protein DF220_11690 [Salinibacterium hongtaonis]|uniref:Glycosyltransferase family 1 protein n=2 Tax=Homoserinimonas hongtaonis TaxID=2079791 RepID=A0A2U1SWS2_9MICO|nr:hypothetical protein DF220_11690 [Salinibacterium hongtaonis]